MTAGAGLQSVHPPAALLATLLFVAAVVSLGSLPPLGAAAALATGTALGLAGGVQPLRGALWTLPFGGLLILVLSFLTPDGLARGLVLALRLISAVLLMTALKARFGTTGLLEAVRGLRVPAIFVSLFGFTLRYTEVLAGESRRMLVARRARGFAVCRRLVDRRAAVTYGQLLGVLLVRAKERSERVYLAMLSRGYRPVSPGQDRRPSLVASGREAALLAVSFLAAFALILWDRSL
ncbi:MAG: energy-coupling factor transporter transmembrane component T [Bacillota bacterium]|nr:energy-coupling factor transporter transmembrane component T [Bacillota bacterium]